MQKGQFFLPSRGVPPPLLRAKNVTDQQFYKGTFAQKKGCIYFFAGCPDFLYKFYLKQNITVLVQGLC